MPATAPRSVRAPGSCSAVPRAAIPQAIRRTRCNDSTTSRTCSACMRGAIRCRVKWRTVALRPRVSLGRRAGFLPAIRRRAIRRPTIHQPTIRRLTIRLRTTRRRTTRRRITRRRVNPGARARAANVPVSPWMVATGPATRGRMLLRSQITRQLSASERDLRPSAGRARAWRESRFSASAPSSPAGCICWWRGTPDCRRRPHRSRPPARARSCAARCRPET